MRIPGGAVLGLIAALSFVPPAAAGIFPYPIETFELENGLLVVMVAMPTPGVVQYQTFVRAGSRNEIEPGRSGYAHFFEHMMFRGTRRFPGPVYGERLNRLGSDGNASTGNDLTVYHMTLPSTGLAAAIELEADRFQNLDYDREQFRKEAGAILGEFEIGRASPWSILEEKRLEKAFRAHPYGHTVIGYEADVRAMPDGFDYSRQFFDRYYRPENCVVLITGDFDARQAEELIRRDYGGWRRGAPAPPVPVEPPLAGPVRDAIEWAGPARPILDISFRTPAYGEQDRTVAALQMLRELVFGETSPLHRSLVLEERVVESLHASFDLQRDPYLFTISAELKDPKDFAVVEARILAALEEAGRIPVDAARLDRAKRRWEASLLLSLETPGGVAWRLSDFISLTGDPRSLDRHAENLRAVTREDLMEAARTYLVPERSVTLTLVGKEERP